MQLPVLSNSHLNLLGALTRLHLLLDDRVVGSTILAGCGRHALEKLQLAVSDGLFCVHCLDSSRAP